MSIRDVKKRRVFIDRELDFLGQEYRDRVTSDKANKTVDIDVKIFEPNNGENCSDAEDDSDMKIYRK